MPIDERIADNVIIYRRISSRPNNTIDRPGIGLTPTSFALKPRQAEEYPSWSMTDPKELLGVEEQKGTDIGSWSVAAVSVASVRDLGLDVERAPTEEDPGHCFIIPTDRQAFTNKIWSRLAKEARIEYTETAGG